MTNRLTRSTFESLMIVPHIFPYWLYWPIIGVMFLGAEVLFLMILGDSDFFWTQLLGSSGIAFLPMANIWLAHSFRTILIELSPLVWSDGNTFYRWLASEEKRIFTLSTWSSKLVTGLIVVLGVATVLVLDLPLKSTASNLVALALFSIVLLFSGQTLYVSIALLSALRKIRNIGMSIPFFMLPHASILRLQSLFSSAALMISAFYAALVIAEWQGPYGLIPLTLIWLVGLAFYPVTLFLWAFFELHYLLREIKLSQIKAINAEVNAALGKVLKEHKSEDADYLDKVMSIQGRIQICTSGRLRAK